MTKDAKPIYVPYIETNHPKYLIVKGKRVKVITETRRSKGKKLSIKNHPIEDLNTDLT